MMENLTNLSVRRYGMALAAILWLLIVQTGFAEEDNGVALNEGGHTGALLLQQKTVHGTVTDSTGSVLVGISVLVKSTPSVGTTTDVNGRFVLEVPQDAVLVFSMVGFETQEIPVAGKEAINVTMIETHSALDEAVVVAFGTQKKESVIGSITTISPKELKVPSSNLTTALAGRLAGVIAFQRSGEPGQDNANFFVRGITTFGANQNPLILIDGIELSTTDLARLPPDDIASFSIMKDATATALYGSRAANGVILVTTKRGKEGKPSIMLRLEHSISAPTKNVELADPVTYMKLHNEAILTRNPLEELFYKDDKIENTVPGSGSIIYPATDWRQELFKDYTTNQRVTLNVSGGGSVARYYVAGNLTQDNGVLRVNGRNNFNNNIDLKTYSLRTNVDISLSKSTEMAVLLSGSFDDYTGPLDGGTGMYRKSMWANPVLFPATYPVDDDHRFVNHIMFGNYGDGNFMNPYADMVRGYKEYARSNIVAQLELKQDLSMLTEGLAVRSMVNTTRYSFFDVLRAYNPFYYIMGDYSRRENTYRVNILNPDTGTDFLTYGLNERDIRSQFYIETAASYNRTFDKHAVSGMLVNILRQSLTSRSESLQESLPFRNFGLSGRATYAYDSRYFAEFNFGFNGTERFYKDHRYGFFPAAGLAWSVSNEKFFEPLKDVISNLRFRATYGIVGNDNISSSRFLYLSEVNMFNSSYGAVFGTENGYSRQGITMVRYSDPNITWETAKKTNFAMELGLMDRLSLVAEYYTEKRENILQQRVATPASMGLAAQPYANIGEATGRGVDLALEYNHAFTNGLLLQGRGNFTYATGKYTVFEEYDYQNAPWRSRIGYPIHQQWGYIAEGLFVDEYEVANSPRQSFGEYMAGDIKYRDINGDGVITTLDQVPIGYPTTPEIIYGLVFSASYKGFDLSGFLQGLARESFWLNTKQWHPDDNPDSTLPFLGNQRQLLKAYADDHWSEENRDVYALWPRLSTTYRDNNAQTSTWFMRDGSFLRLKQVEVGYSLPMQLVQRVSMSSLRLYVTGTNLFTLSKFNLWDVEMAGNGLGYPVQRVFNFGLSATF
ncbi:MAG TPA: TonB-dependent receptor [Parapedobacter sp.]|uniref:SusC/RagA family TonB-linked outer membrane protein n=1 Tax=Parapedobacter sp. TaxID=1958893 RepID=UPI002BFFE4CB|nr:TonB-dependent receptor [Parapedobacter sp.]HWK56711.1 TonB-dependent receptor [Parapedobacter sp.]